MARLVGEDAPLWTPHQASAAKAAHSRSLTESWSAPSPGPPLASGPDVDKFTWLGSGLRLQPRRASCRLQCGGLPVREVWMLMILEQWLQWRGEALKLAA